MVETSEISGGGEEGVGQDHVGARDLVGVQTSDLDGVCCDGQVPFMITMISLRRVVTVCL